MRLQEQGVLPNLCTNPTLRIGAGAAPARGGWSSISPEISTRPPTNGTSALLSAESRYVWLADFFAESDVPVPGGTRVTRAALVRTNADVLGAFSSWAGTDPRPLGDAHRRQPVTVILSARLGGSGCRVPGVGLPVNRPVPWAARPTLSAPAITTVHALEPISDPELEDPRRPRLRRDLPEERGIEVRDGSLRL